MYTLKVLALLAAITPALTVPVEGPPLGDLVKRDETIIADCSCLIIGDGCEAVWYDDTKSVVS
jgi:hypothetical protein